MNILASSFYYILTLRTFILRGVCWGTFLKEFPTLPEFVPSCQFRKKLYSSCTCQQSEYIFKQEKSSYSILLVYKHFQFARFVSENIWQRSLGQEAQSDPSLLYCLHTYYIQCCYIHMYCVWLNLSTYFNNRCQ